MELTKFMIRIVDVSIKDHYATISKMMDGLHAHEKALFDKASEWKYIEASYMRHVIDTQEKEEGTCLLALDEAEPVGFIFGYAYEEEDSRTEDYKGLELYVSDGFVAASHRRLGVYKQLNDALENKYITEGIRRIVRFTLSSNLRMQKFLGHAGYQPVRLQYEKWLKPDGSLDELGFTPT